MADHCELNTIDFYINLSWLLVCMSISIKRQNVRKKFWTDNKCLEKMSIFIIYWPKWRFLKKIQILLTHFPLSISSWSLFWHKYVQIPCKIPGGGGLKISIIPPPPLFRKSLYFSGVPNILFQTGFQKFKWKYLFSATSEK